jgi:hypothetical protein
MLTFAASLMPLIESDEQRDLHYEATMSRLRRGYFDALRKMSGGHLYPDANLSLRLRYGTVEGYTPRDATHCTPQATLSGVLQKEMGKEPFANPKPLLAAAKDQSRARPRSQIVPSTSVAVATADR